VSSRNLIAMLKTKAFVVSEIHPRLLTKLEALQKACQVRGVDYWAISGFRSWEEQTRLYALGRTVKNVDATPEKPLGGIVTNAKAGLSMHNYGLAADFAPDKDKVRSGLQPDWNFPAYQILAEEAVKLGLESGFYWKFKDGPHVQVNLSKLNMKISDLVDLYNKGGRKLVWDTLDKFNW